MQHERTTAAYRDAAAGVPLRFWLAGVGEYVPSDLGHHRLLRMGLLAQTLHERGHDVTWWCSTYDHEGKRHRYDRFTTVELDPRYRLHFLHGRGYRRNVSVARLINHRQVAADFRARSNSTPEPHLLLTSMPTIELAAACAAYASRRALPLVVDVRDQHPDIYLSLVPAVARPLGRLAMAPLRRSLASTLRQARVITATSETFLDWALQIAGRARHEEDGVFPLAYPMLAPPEEDVRAAGERLSAQGLTRDRRIVWYIGTFNRWIDLATPIAAARRIAERGRRDLLFVFSGDGDFAARWRKMATDLPNVLFTGWIRQPEIAYLRSIAWAGLAPYRAGFTTVGNKLFEFMSGGLPIMASATGEPRHMIEALGVGVPYRHGDAGDLAEKLLGLAEDALEHARMSEASRNAYEQFYRAEVVYAQMAELLEAQAMRNLTRQSSE